MLVTFAQWTVGLASVAFVFCVGWECGASDACRAIARLAKDQIDRDDELRCARCVHYKRQHTIENERSGLPSGCRLLGCDCSRTYAEGI